MDLISRPISVVVSAILLISCAPANQQFEVVQTEKRSITVTGYGELELIPETAIWIIGIDSFDKEVTIATDENEEIASKVMNVLRHYNIDEADIFTDYIDTLPEVNDSTDTILRYRVSRVIKVTIRSLNQLADIKANVLIAGANRQYGLYFQVADLAEHRAEARALAIEAAHAKAEKLAVQLDQELGEPISIIEINDSQPSPLGFSGGHIVTAYTNYYNFDDAVVFGKILLSSAVSVEFELK